MFARHISLEHDMWHYLYFFAFLKYKYAAIKRQQKARKRWRELNLTSDSSDGELFSRQSNQTTTNSNDPNWHHLLRFSHVQREIFKKINSGNEEDTLSIFPIERSQTMEEFERQNEAKKEHELIIGIQKVKKKVKDTHQLIKQVIIQQANVNGNFGQASGLSRVPLTASSLGLPLCRQDGT